ncbi:hypothetical protein [Nocardioides sp. GXZ039]|uniref:hypothetical protein n=1 Tax=Nocardioides sp. GXZ039 TaxID=3136018 RepID=UPI0030F3BF8E
MAIQRWHLVAGGVRHRVEADTSGWRNHVRWWADDVLVAERRTAEDKFEVRPAADGEGDGDRDRDGVMAFRFTPLGRPRRATWYPADEADQAGLGLGGTDLIPEAGSPVARFEERIREHPRRYALQRTATAILGVLLPLLLGLVAVRVAVSLPWPDLNLPSIPWPDWDLPSIPWPSLPSIPWPDWSLPGWFWWLVEKSKFVWPVVIAYALARGEIRRRRTQDERRGDDPDDEAPAAP